MYRHIGPRERAALLALSKDTAPRGTREECEQDIQALMRVGLATRNIYGEHALTELGRVLLPGLDVSDGEWLWGVLVERMLLRLAQRPIPSWEVYPADRAVLLHMVESDFVLPDDNGIWALSETGQDACRRLARADQHLEMIGLRAR